MIPMLLVAGRFADTANIRIKRRRRYTWVSPISPPMPVGIHLNLEVPIWISMAHKFCRGRTGMASFI
jgi:hypothetical protein